MYLLVCIFSLSTYQIVFRRHSWKLLDLAGHGGSHIGLHCVHTRKLANGWIGCVHLRVAGHIVHTPGARVPTIGATVGGVDISHHTVTGRDDWWKGLGQLFLLFTILRSSVLKPNLKNEINVVTVHLMLLL